jgi:hypothetical protein
MVHRGDSLKMDPKDVNESLLLPHRLVFVGPLSLNDGSLHSFYFVYLFDLIQALRIPKTMVALCILFILFYQYEISIFLK